MPPKTAPTIEQLYASFTEKVEDFDSRKGCLDALGELPDKTLRKLGEINKAIEELAKDMERSKPDFASEYPDVLAEWERTFISLTKLRIAKEKEIHTATDYNEKKEPDYYDVPTVRSDRYKDHTSEANHYEAHTGEADHYKATLERTDESTEVFDDEDEKEALVVASKEKEEVNVEVALQEKEACVHSSLYVVASQEEEADTDDASREEKEVVDGKVDATRLDKTMEVSSEEENHPVEEKQPKTDELFENYDQFNEIDVLTNDDQANENDDHSKENDEVIGDKYDQVKIEELFEIIAIFLFFPNYKYRKKRWPKT